MSIGLLLPQLGELDPVEVAVTAEALGYESVWAPELWGTSSAVKLTEIATRTESIGLGTAIMNVFSRTPAVLAMTAVTLDQVSEGRFTLGVGTSTPKIVEDLHGMAFDRPVRRAHETIEAVQAFTRGEGRVDYDGQLFELADFPSLDHEVPIYHAALGPANRRVVGRLCDGWIPHNVPFPNLEQAFETVETTAREAGRDPSSIDVAPWIPAAVSEDHDEAMDAIRGHVAYYVGSGEGYRKAVGEMFPDGADAVAENWRAGDRGEATAAVTDEMVDALGVAATPETAQDRLAELLDGSIIDRPTLVVPNNAVDSLGEQTVQAFVPG